MAEQEAGNTSDARRPSESAGLRLDAHADGSHAEDLDVCDDLAELFLGPAPRPLRVSENDGGEAACRCETPAEPGALDTPVHASDGHEDTAAAAHGYRKPPEVEALILGHLPVMAGMWVGHYAQHTAAQLGDPVGVVRRSDDAVQVRLYGTHETQSGMFGDLEIAIRSHGAGVTRWVLRVDRPGEDVLPELDADRLTLLSTSDDAAVVASYRTLKGLAARFAHEPDSEDEASAADLPGLRVVVIENAKGSGGAAASRLADAARVFLNRPIETVVIPAKLGRQPAVTLFDGACTWADRELIDELRATADLQLVQSSPPVEKRASRPAAPAPPASSMSDAPLPKESAPPLVEPRMTRGPSYRPSLAGTKPDRLVMGSVSQHNATIDHAPPEHESDTPRKQEQGDTSSARRSALAEDDIIARLVPGLRPLGEVCPYEPGVVLATDRDEQLHALVLARGDAASVAAVRSLEAVRAWLASHGGLVLRASGFACERDPGGPAITLHLLSTAPASVRRLLDADIALHAVTSVQTESGEQLGAVRLN